MKMLDQQDQTKLAELLTGALRSARLENAGFGFSNDRIEVVSLHGGETTGIRTGDVMHPTNYVRAITNSYRHSWLIGPIVQAMDLLGIAIPAIGPVHERDDRSIPTTRAPRRIELTPHEVQSGLDRVRAAENLIIQMPDDHDGRASWLLNYGHGDEAQAMRARHVQRLGHAVSFPGVGIAPMARSGGTTIAVGAGQVVDAEFVDPAVPTPPPQCVTGTSGIAGFGIREPRPHKHATLIKQWADDPGRTVWFFDPVMPMRGWIELAGDPVWNPKLHYAIGDKPTAVPRRMCTLAGVEFPAPETEPPEIGASYWSADTSLQYAVQLLRWDGDAYDMACLNNGFVHATRAAAEAHTNAVISATKQAIESAR